MKRPIDERKWRIDKVYLKTAHEVSYEKYFMKKFEARFKLDKLKVYKNILSEDEKELLILWSITIRRVWLYYPMKMDGWTSKNKIEVLVIDISYTFVSKNDFKEFVLPWIQLDEELHLYLDDDTNFFDDICEWLRGSNFKSLQLKYGGKYFNCIEELKVFFDVEKKK